MKIAIIFFIIVFQKKIKPKSEAKYKELGIKIIDEYDNLRVLISNQGDVIPVHKRQKIFEEFYQIDDSRKTEGNGLGLPLVRRILDLHQSTVMVKQSDEKATVFEVILKKNPE